LLKSGELDIRNSPLDKYASMLGRVLLCAKGVCDSANPIGVGLGLILGADQVLKDCYAGREAFFGPILGSGLNKILSNSELDHWRDAYLEATKILNNASKFDKFISDYLKQTPDLVDVNNEDKKDLLQLLSELKNVSTIELESAKALAVQLLEEKLSNKI